MKKRRASDIRQLISAEEDVYTSLSFKCSKQKEKMALQLIADEMDETGAGFKEALINLIYSGMEQPVITKKRVSKRQPNINSARIDLHKNHSVPNESANEEPVVKDTEIAPKEIDDKPQEKKIEPDQPKVEENKKSVADIIAEKKQQNEENKNDLSAEDKESLRQRLINSYKL